MSASVQKAVELILSADPELLNILATTARVSLTSSLIALLLGVPLGLLYGAGRFPGRQALLVANRTLMGMPPVVCGLLFYLLFSGVGPFRRFRLLFTVPLMILAQVVLITPIVIGTMETSAAGIAPAMRETAIGLRLGKGPVMDHLSKLRGIQLPAEIPRCGTAVLVHHGNWQVRRHALPQEGQVEDRAEGHNRDSTQEIDGTARPDPDFPPDDFVYFIEERHFTTRTVIPGRSPSVCSSGTARTSKVLASYWSVSLVAFQVA